MIILNFVVSLRFIRFRFVFHPFFFSFAHMCIRMHGCMRMQVLEQLESPDKLVVRPATMEVPFEVNSTNSPFSLGRANSRDTTFIRT